MREGGKMGTSENRDCQWASKSSYSYDWMEQIRGGVWRDVLEGNFWEVRSYANFYCFRRTTATQRIESNFDITFNAFQIPESINSSCEKKQKKKLPVFKNTEEQT